MEQTTVSQYIFKHLANIGVKYVFMLSGGGAMWLNQALLREKRITPICCHHEQACAIAAEGYARTTGNLAVVLVTSGPGGLNTLTGVMGQWTDSIPVLYISGQVPRNTLISPPSLRQLGDQEINILDIVASITKYHVTVHPNSIDIELQMAIAYALGGRKGPVWLDVWLDDQNKEISIDENVCCNNYFSKDLCDPEKASDKILEELEKAERPLFIAGHGIRLSGSKEKFLQLLEKFYAVPVVTTFNGFDLVHCFHTSYVGRIGTIGTRNGNKVLQEADLIICFGTRNNIRQVSYQWQNFAKNAKKIIIDIDYSELIKPTIEGDILYHGDVGKIIDELLKCEFDYLKFNSLKMKWYMDCFYSNEDIPNIDPIHLEKKEDGINPYIFVEKLSKELKDDAVVVVGNGTPCVSYFQVGYVKENQRVFWNSGTASMGYALPAAIGACFANGRKDVICIDGDGSFMMNIQELQTIKHHNLPIKIFILNNKGYHSIRQTQQNYFNEGEFIGVDKDSGVSFPSFQKVAFSYDIFFWRIIDEYDFCAIDKVLNYEGPVICEVNLTKDYIFAPKLKAEKNENGELIAPTLERMYPYYE